MKLSLFVIASIMTSYVLAAPAPGDKTPHGQVAKGIADRIKELTEELNAQRKELRSSVIHEIRAEMKKGTRKEHLSDQQWIHASDAERLTELWELHKEKFSRKFKNNEAEAKRREIFEKKLSLVIQHNTEAKLNKHKFTMGINHLSDWTQQELDTLRGYKPRQIVMLNDYSDYDYSVDDLEAQAKDVAEGERAITYLPIMPTYTNTIPTSQLPGYVNWSNTSWVGPVQNQRQCGSCWAFSAAGSLEAQYYNKTQTFVAMSEQNLVDCTYYLGNLGCSGGNVELAFDYVMTVGIDSFESYPYRGKANNGTCLYNAANSVTQATSWRLIPSGNELALQQAVALAGPVSVAIDASQSSFDYYSGGIYAPANCSTTDLDHAVLVVGYGTTSEGQDYWLIKNSWDTDWGIDGYMMMERGVNMCGIATEALFPVID